MADLVLNQILENKTVPTYTSVEFISSSIFNGRKEGYVFHNGPRGVGYYKDNNQEFSGNRIEENNKKRDIGQLEGTSTSQEQPSIKQERTITQILEDADQTEIVPLDSTSVKKLLANFEKKITKNQKQRMKFENEPEKFMESEIELHNEIQELYAIAAYPELYPIVVQSGAVTSMVGVVTHENTDISIAMIGLLQEMTEVDTILEDKDAAMPFIETFLQLQGLELIIQNLFRLQEGASTTSIANEEDAKGIQTTLSIVENLIEINPEISQQLCVRTHLLKFLLQRINQKTFDGIKQYSAEILSIILQSHPLNGRHLCSLEDIHGMDAILQAIAQYRKKDVTLTEEQECVEDIFLCLNTLLSQRIHQQLFLQSEGFELLIRCLKEQNYISICAVGTLSYAIMKYSKGCEKLIDVGGLKFIFSFLMKKGISQKKLKKKKMSKTIVRGLEYSLVTILSQLCVQLPPQHKMEYQARLIKKFIENDHEKFDKIIELFIKYFQIVTETDQQIEKIRSDLEGTEEYDEFNQEDNIYSQRLEGGLFELQQLSIIITFLCIHYAPGRQKTKLKMESEGDYSLQQVLAVLRDMNYVLHLPSLQAMTETADTATQENGDKNLLKDDINDAMEEVENERQKKLLIEWSAGLSVIVKEL